MRSYNDYLLLELKTGIDHKTNKPFNIALALLKNKHVIFHVNQSGEVVPGYPPNNSLSYDPYVEIGGGYKSSRYSVRLQNLNPSSKLFSQIYAWIKQTIPDIKDQDIEIMGLGHATTDKKSYYRSAGYWNAIPRTDFNERPPTYLFHGTSTELWYEGIKSKGLLPREQNPVAASGSYGTDPGALSHGDKVYLSVHPDQAARAAAKQASNQHGGWPLILRVSTRGLFPEKFGADEDAKHRIETLKKRNAKTNQQQASQAMMGTVSYQGRIPPNNIEPLMILKKGEGAPAWGKWEPFKDVERAKHPWTDKLNQDNFFSHNEPEFFALYDAGLVTYNDKGDIQKAKEVTDEEVRRALKNAPWRTTALSISNQLSDWGMKGIKGLDGMPTKSGDPEHQKIINCLIDNKIYGVDKDTLYKVYIAGEQYTKRSIGLAKCIAPMDYRQLNKIIGDMLK